MSDWTPDRSHITALLDSWSGRDVLVVGDAMLDEWRFAESDRLCREAPAPVLALRRLEARAGGAANTAVNVAALGGRATFVAPLGADPAGDEVRGCLRRAGVRDQTVAPAGHRTPVKRRLVAGDQILLREDEGDRPGPVPEDTVRLLLDALTAAVECAADAERALVICDYGLGGLSDPVRAWLIEHRHRFTTVALDAHDLARWHGLHPTLITPSLAETLLLLNRPLPDGVHRTRAAESYLTELRDHTDAEVVAVTLDVDGAVVADRAGSAHHTPSDPVPPSHAVGAGDAYLAAMTLALAAGVPVSVAADIAQLTAAVTLTQPGTCIADRNALLAAARADSTILGAAELAMSVRRRREQGQRIVFTNGCFDVLHRGHVRLLDQAAALGDALVVAVNSDDSVRRLKGPDRPVNPVEDRVAVLAALSCVDHVVVFEEDSPADLIETIRPEVYVKGGDYPPDLVPEAPLVRSLGGEVHILGYVPDRSTSAIIDRIRSRAPISGSQK